MSRPEPSTDHVLALCALGVPVKVRFVGKEPAPLAREAREAWVDCLVDDHRPREYGGELVEAGLFDDEDERAAAAHDGVVTAATPDVLMELLTQRITRTAINAQAGKLTMFHACGLADPNTGATVALVAPSGTGKTTLVQTLGRRFAYVTDETVAISDDGTVVAYPKPLSVLPSSGVRVKEQVPASRLGLITAPGLLKLAAIIKLNRHATDHAIPVQERISIAKGVYEIGPEVSFLASRNRPLHHLADLLQSTGGATVIRYQEAETLGDLVGRLLTEVSP